MMILRCLRVKPLHPCAISCNLKPPVASKSLTVWSVGQRIEFRHGFSPQKMSWQVTHRQELWRSTLQLAQKALEEGRRTRSVFFWASNMSTDSGAGPPIGSLGISHLIIGVPNLDLYLHRWIVIVFRDFKYEQRKPGRSHTSVCFEKWEGCSSSAHPIYGNFQGSRLMQIWEI